MTSKPVQERYCGWSGTQQQHRKHETGTQQQGRKILGPSWNFCLNGHDTELIHWYYAGLRVLSKNVGITNCRRQLKLYTSVKVGHSRTSDLFKVWYGVHLRTVTTTFIYTINEDPTASEFSPTWSLSLIYMCGLGLTYLFLCVDGHEYNHKFDKLIV